MQGKTSGRLRFAPSPNGLLHLGHAYSALTSAAVARAEGAELILRIEDIDVGRCRPEYEIAMLEDLAWLGLIFPEPLRRQSEHMCDYEEVLKRLRAMDLVYPCFASRREIIEAIESSGVGMTRWPRDPDGAPIYPGIYKDMAPRELNRLMWEGRSFAWRLDMEKAIEMAVDLHGGPITFVEEGTGPAGETGEIEAQPELFGDVLIARKDVPTSYHIAVTHDDALQGVTLVTRGQDLFHSTHVHRLLQVLMGWPAPRYRHHPLIRDETGRRLSKSARDTGLRELRQEGMSADDVRRLIGLE